MSSTRAMIYTRISSDSEGRELGVTHQLDDCTTYAERNGWTVVREYRDNDRGASTRSRKSRPEYDAMVALMAHLGERRHGLLRGRRLDERARPPSPLARQT